MSYITPSGLARKTLPELKAEYETLFQTTFGGDIDLSASGPFGQLIGLLAKRDADLWDLVQEVYVSRDPNQASGVSLDMICAETGVTRQAAGPTRVYNVEVGADNGTTLPVGTQARCTRTQVTYNLITATTISASSCNGFNGVVESSVGEGDVVSVTVGSGTYSYTLASGDTAEDAATEVANALNASGLATAVVSGASISVRSLSAYAYATSNIAVSQYVAYTAWEATVDGPSECPLNTLSVKVTNVNGWEWVLNALEAGQLGRNTETDAELRARRAAATSVGKATEEAIRQAVLSVPDVTECMVESNRSPAQVGDLPPHCFHVVAVNGLDADVAAAIWDTMPAGIQDYGSIAVPITDSQGIVHNVHFDRPVPLYLWVKVQVWQSADAPLPADWADQIQDAMEAWCSKNLVMGGDIYLQRLATPVYEVAGVGQIHITTFASVDPEDTPVYNNVPISVSSTQMPELVSVVTELEV